MISRPAPRSYRGPAFRAQRDEMGLSLRYVAHVSGYSVSYLAGIERGSAPLPIDTAAVLDTTFAKIRRRMGAGRAA